MQASSMPTSVIQRSYNFKDLIGYHVKKDVFDPTCDRKKTCQVCGDNKILKFKIYGATTPVCNACRVFFSRAANYTLICKCEGGAIYLNRYTRRDCKSCRYQSCIFAGMSHDQEKRKIVNGKDDGKNYVNNDVKNKKIIKVTNATVYPLISD